jgi:hypothetical protein
VSYGHNLDTRTDLLIKKEKGFPLVFSISAEELWSFIAQVACWTGEVVIDRVWRGL